MLTIALPRHWVDARAFDTSLLSAGDPLTSNDSVRILVPSGAKIMVDAAVRLLSFAQQVAAEARGISLEFEDASVVGYLDRIGFFDALHVDVSVVPDRPSESAAKLYRGNNGGVVEIARLAPGAIDKALPGRLADAVSLAVSAPSEKKKLNSATFTVFAELIENVYLHSASVLDGFASLQIYRPQGKVKAKVIVADSGQGIVETLRPTLERRLRSLSDTELIVEAFRQGISRHGAGRGCGLRASAEHAIKYKAELDVRLPRCRVHLIPSTDGYKPNVAECAADQALLQGTHLCFDFVFGQSRQMQPMRKIEHSFE